MVLTLFAKDNFIYKDDSISTIKKIEALKKQIALLNKKLKNSDYFDQITTDNQELISTLSKKVGVLERSLVKTNQDLIKLQDMVKGCNTQDISSMQSSATLLSLEANINKRLQSVPTKYEIKKLINANKKLNEEFKRLKLHINKTYSRQTPKENHSLLSKYYDYILGAFALILLIFLVMIMSLMGKIRKLKILYTSLKEEQNKGE